MEKFRAGIKLDFCVEQRRCVCLKLLTQRKARERFAANLSYAVTIDSLTHANFSLTQKVSYRAAGEGDRSLRSQGYAKKRKKKKGLKETVNDLCPVSNATAPMTQPALHQSAVYK